MSRRNRPQPLHSCIQTTLRGTRGLHANEGSARARHGHLSTHLLLLHINDLSLHSPPFVVQIATFAEKRTRVFLHSSQDGRCMCGWARGGQTPTSRSAAWRVSISTSSSFLLPNEISVGNFIFSVMCKNGHEFREGSAPARHAALPQVSRYGMECNGGGGGG